MELGNKKLRVVSISYENNGYANQEGKFYIISCNCNNGKPNSTLF